MALKKKTGRTVKSAKPKSENFTFMRFRCETCGERSAKPGEHCGYPMVDLLSDTCMACRGCQF